MVGLGGQVGWLHGCSSPPPCSLPVACLKALTHCSLFLITWWGWRGGEMTGRQPKRYLYFSLCDFRRSS